MPRAVVLALALAVAGCGDGATRLPAEPDPPVTTPCALDELDVDGACVPKGLPGDLACPPGEQLVDEGCVPAGVPPSRCAEGFEPRDDGCDAVLPATPCPEGEMALLGETSCRPVVPCPTDGWGDAPDEPNAIHVDAASVGTPDGSEGAPWPTIQQAVDAAADGALVLVAPGTYAEHVTIAGKGVRLWGTCPSEVTVQGPAEGVGAIDVIDGAHGTELHRIGIRGARVGVGSSDATSVLLDEIWVHDTVDQGLLADSVLGASEMTVRRSLVERTGLGGMVIVGAEVILEDAVLRDGGGRGVDVLSSPVNGGEASVSMDGVVVERATGGGIVVAGSSATMRRIAVFDTAFDGSGQRGWGVAAFDVPGFAATAATLTNAVVERSHDAGVIASASTTLVENVTVRDVAPSPMGPGAVGMTIDAWTGTSPGVTGTIRQSLVERAVGLGVFLGGTLDATLEGVQVRGTLVDADGAFGWGVAVQPANDLGQPASVQMRDSAVRDNVGSGVFVHGSSLVMETTAVTGTASEPSGRFGPALTVTDDPIGATPGVVHAWASVLSGNAEAGIVIAGSQVVVDRCELHDNLPDGTGAYGDGVLVFGTGTAPSHLDLTGSRVVGNARAGVACFGATVALADTLVACHDFALNAETYAGIAGELLDLGGNTCGCDPLSATCKAVSSALEPPQAVDAPYEPEH